MQALVIGDPHFKDNNPMEMEEMSEKIIAEVMRIMPDFIVCLGDVLDRHEKISLFALRRSVIFLEKLASLAKTYVLIGNHDRPNNSTYLTDEHAFIACRRWENLVVVDDVIRDGDFVFVPYVPPGRFIEALDRIPGWRGAKAVFAHQEMSGAKMGAVVSTAEEWGPDYPPLISGHIHDYQRVRENLVYVGTPIQHGYHDTQDKGISLFRIGEKVEEERIDLRCRKKAVIRLSPDELKAYIPPDNVSLKIVVEGEREELRLLSKDKKVRELRDKGVKVHFKPRDNKLVPPKKEGGYFSTLKELIAGDDLQLRWLERLLSE